MQRLAEAWQGIGAYFAFLILVLSQAVAPAIEALEHGPGAIAAEADLRAWHAENCHSHDMPSADSHDHHDSSDHDHVSATILLASWTEIALPPKVTLRPRGLVADGAIRDGPRRPPRLALI